MYKASNFISAGATVDEATTDYIGNKEFNRIQINQGFFITRNV